MSRNISIAKFYDCTDELYECVSVSKSKIHQTMCNVPQLFVGKSKSQSIRWCSNGVRVNHERMFCGEKGNLTKGEFNIIPEIYQNSGKVTSDESFESARLHRDAWLVGKHSGNCSGIQTEYVMASVNKRSVPSLVANGRKTTRSNQKYCSLSSGPTKINICFSNSIKYQSCQIQDKTAKCATIIECSTKFHSKTDGGTNYFEGKDLESYALSNRADECHEYGETYRGKTMAENELIQDGEMCTSGASLMLQYQNQTKLTFEMTDLKDSMLHNNQECSEQNECNKTDGKLQMEVFLPSVPLDPTEDDIKLLLHEGRPLIERERPMSHSQYKLKLNKKIQ